MVAYQINTSFALPCFTKFEEYYRSIKSGSNDKVDFFFAYIFLATYLELFLQAAFQGIILIVFSHHNPQKISDWRKKDQQPVREKIHEFLSIFAVDKKTVGELQSLFSVVQGPHHPLIHGHEIFYTGGYIVNSKSQRTLQYFQKGKFLETIKAYDKFCETWGKGMDEIRDFCRLKFPGVHTDFRKIFALNEID